MLRSRNVKVGFDVKVLCAGAIQNHFPRGPFQISLGQDMSKLVLMSRFYVRKPSRIISQWDPVKFMSRNVKIGFDVQVLCAGAFQNHIPRGQMH